MQNTPKKSAEIAPIHEHEQAEADDLMEAVVEHLKALSETSEPSRLAS